MKTYEAATIVLVVAAAYWVIADWVRPDPEPMCYTQIEAKLDVVYGWVPCDTLPDKELK